MLKRSVIISLIGFSIITTAVIVLIFNSSIERDTRHMKLCSLACETENALLETRIIADRIVMHEDTGIVRPLKKRIDSVRLIMQELQRQVNSGYFHFTDKVDYDFRQQAAIILRSLRQLNDTLDHSGEEDFSKSFFPFFNYTIGEFREYRKHLPDLLILDKSRYKLVFGGIVLLNLLFLFLTGLLIIKLINRLIMADRNLIRNTIEVENRERERIAADLHDGLGALLSGLIIHMQVLEKEYKHDPKLKKRIAQLNNMATSALQSSEEVINNLNPSSLSRNGLVKSLSKIIEKINVLGKTRFTLDASRLNIDFPESTETLLYRVCTELINNALKHSEAEHAGFEFFNYKREVHLRYKDDGIGFLPEQQSYPEKKRGLYNLMRRVESMEGSCKINSGPGKGTEIEIVLKMA